MSTYMHRSGYYKYTSSSSSSFLNCVTIYLLASWTYYCCWMYYMVFIVYWDGPSAIIWLCFHNHTEKRKPIISRAGPAAANGLSALLKGTQQYLKFSALLNSCIVTSGNSPKYMLAHFMHFMVFPVRWFGPPSKKKPVHSKLATLQRKPPTHC